MQPPNIMVMGVGSILFSDEGLGVRFLDELAKTPLPDNVEIVEGGTAGLELIALIQETDFLIIVDAVNAQDEPGAMFRFRPKDLRFLPEPFQVSFHQVGLLDMLNAASLIGKVPETLIFGVQPKSLEWSMEISPEIRAVFPRIAELVLREIDSINQSGGFCGGNL